MSNEVDVFDASAQTIETTLLEESPYLGDQTPMADRGCPRHKDVSEIARDAWKLVNVLPNTTLLRNASVFFYYASNVENALFNVTVGAIRVNGTLPYNWSDEQGTQTRKRLLTRVAAVVELQATIESGGPTSSETTVSTQLDDKDAVWFREAVERILKEAGPQKYRNGIRMR